MHKGNVLALLLSLALPSFCLPNLRAAFSSQSPSGVRGIAFSTPFTKPIRAHMPPGCWILSPTGIQLWPQHLLVSGFKKDYPTFSHSAVYSETSETHPGAAKPTAKQSQHWAVCSEHAAPLAPDGHSCAIYAAVSFSPLWCGACISISSDNRNLSPSLMLFYVLPTCSTFFFPVQLVPA